MADRLGQQFGNYRLVSLLGQGGYAKVYLTDFPFIPLYFPLDLSIARQGTHNYEPSPFSGDTDNIWEWWCDNGKC